MKKDSLSGTSLRRGTSAVSSRALLSLLVAAGLAGNVRAVDYIKANNGTALDLAGSYTANSGVPGATDRLVVTSAMTANQTASVGAGLSVDGILFDATANKQLTIGGTNGLSIGASGINLTAALSGATIVFNAPAISLAADQTWDFGGRGATFTGNSTTLVGTTIANNGFNLTINSTAQIQFSNTTMTLNAAIIGTTALTLGNNGANLTLTNANSTTNGAIAISAGNSVSAASMRVGTGTSSAIGIGTLQLKGGAFRYTGNTATSSQQVQFDSRFLSSFEVTTAGQTLTLSKVDPTNLANSIAGTGYMFTGAGNIVVDDVIEQAALSTTGLVLTKAGAGTLTLTKVNTFTGATTVSAGTMVLSGVGSVNSSSGANVAAGATFTNNTATAFNKALFLAEGAVVNGTGAFNATSLSLSADLSDGFTTFNLGGAGLLKAGSLQLTLAGVVAGNYTLFQNGSITGTYASMSINGNALTGVGGDFSGVFGGFNYAYTNSSNLLSVTTAVPEPSTLSLMVLGGLGVVGAMRRRRS